MCCRKSGSLSNAHSQILHLAAPKNREKRAKVGKNVGVGGVGGREKGEKEGREKSRKRGKGGKWEKAGKGDKGRGNGKREGKKRGKREMGESGTGAGEVKLGWNFRGILW